MSTPNDNGSAVALSGFNVLSFTLARQLLGTWTLEAELDVGSSPAPIGAQALTYATAAGKPIAYACAILESRPAIGRATVFAVGGAGGLRNELVPIDYAEIAPRAVFVDICRDSHPIGADGAPSALISERPDPAALAALSVLPRLPRWSRPIGTGAAALTSLCAKLTVITGKRYGWRVNRDGTVWMGVEAWPAYVSTAPGKPEPPYYTAEPDAAGVGVVALEAPDLDPGTTIAAPDDQAATGATLRISQVLYTCSEDGVFRARVLIAVADRSQDRQREDRRRYVESVLPPQSLRVPWFATVVSQDSDGALGLRLEAGAPLFTLSQVPYYPGLPGMRVTVPMGAQCIVEFVGGREDSPIVRSFARNTPFTLIRFNDGTAGMARVGDAVAGTQILSALADVVTGVVTFVTQEPGGAPDTSVAPKLPGVVASGMGKVQG